MGIRERFITGVKSLSPFRTIEPWVDDKPLVNEPLGIIQHPYGVYQPISYFTLWAYFKDSPEVVSCISAIIDDIISDGYVLEGTEEDRKKAEEFLSINNFKKQLESFLFDAFVTGDGYMHISRLNPSAIKSMIAKTISQYSGYEMKADSFYDEIVYDAEKEGNNLFAVKSFQYLPSSTMRIDFNIHGEINQYVQWVGSQWRWFSEDEIIHYPLISLDGKVYGYTPMQSVLKEMDTITNIKDFQKYFFEKGGVMPWLFIFEDESPDSPTIKAFKKSLQQYASLQNKWKSLVMTGKVEAQKMMDYGKDFDMSFRELARYFTQIIVNVFGVPSTRLPGLLLDSKIKGESSPEGYYRKISHQQDVLEDMANNRILKEYNVKLRFNRTYKQDEVRNVQIDKIMTDVVEQRLKLGLWTFESAAEYLRIPEEKRGKFNSDALMGSSMNQGQLNKHQMLSESDKLAADQKRQTSAVDKP